MTRRSPSGLVNGGVDIVGANDEREGRIVRRKAASSEEIGEGLKGKREVAEHTYTVDVACLEGQRSLQACPNYGPQQISQQISLDQAAPIGSEGGPSRRPTNSIVSTHAVETLNPSLWSITAGEATLIRAIKFKEPSRTQLTAGYTGACH